MDSEKANYSKTLLSFAVLTIFSLSVPSNVFHFSMDQARATVSTDLAGQGMGNASQSIDVATTISQIREIELAQNASEPLAITTDKSGNVWFAENNPAALVEYNPTAKAFTTYQVPLNGSSMIWFMLFDDNGTLWFSNALQPYLWSFSPVTHRFSNFSTGKSSVDPYGLAYDNNTQEIWFTSIYTDQIGNFKIAGNQATLVGLINVTGTRPNSLGPKYGPSGIEIDSLGNIFVSDTFSGNIVEYSQVQQQFTHFWTLPLGSEPVGIAVDASRDRIWFTNHASSLIGYIDQRTGKITEYATSFFSYLGDNITLPYWIQLSSDGQIWFDEHAGNKMARFDPSTGQLTEFLIPTNQSAPLRFVIDSAHNFVWFTEFLGNKLGELSENQSCNCVVQLSRSTLTLSSKTVQVNMMYTGPTGAGLATLEGREPLFSGSSSTDGYLGDNLTISTTMVNSSFYKISLEHGALLSQGNYSLTICPNTSLLSILQCATVLLVVPPEAGLAQLEIVLAVVIVGVALVISIFFVRRWR
jgi:virginiamycin B lyase